MSEEAEQRAVAGPQPPEPAARPGEGPGNGQDARRVPKPRHIAESHPWVVRTPETDESTSPAKLLAAWPLLWMWAIRQVHLRYRQSVLGWSWTVLQPVAIMAIYGFVLTAFLDVSGGELPYLAMAWSGLTVWMYVQATVQPGVTALRADAWVLSKVWFPRAIVPLAPVVGGTIDLAVAGVILFGIAAAYGIGLSVHLLALPLVLAVVVVWCAAICVFTSVLTVFLRDVATVVALWLRLMFFATPIMYPPDLVPADLRYIVTANPFAAVVNGVRDTVLAHRWPNWELLALHGAVGLVLFALALQYLRSVERRMIDVI